VTEHHISKWRQGCCFTLAQAPALKEAVRKEHRCEESAYIVLTHSCSVSKDDFNLEPDAEYIVATPIEKADNGYINRRHQRKLHMPVLVHGEEKWHEIYISRRGFFDRRLLDTFSPDASKELSKDNLAMLCKWMASRYTMPAFPGEFNNRRKNACEKIAKKLSNPQFRHISGVFLSYEPEDEELSPEEDYEIGIMLAIDATCSEAEFRECEEIEGYIKTVFQNSKGLTLTGEQVIAKREDEITLADIKHSYRLQQIDYLSERDMPGGDQLQDEYICL